MSIIMSSADTLAIILVTNYDSSSVWTTPLAVMGLLYSIVCEGGGFLFYSSMIFFILVFYFN